MRTVCTGSLKHTTHSVFGTPCSVDFVLVCCSSRSAMIFSLSESLSRRCLSARSCTPLRAVAVRSASTAACSCAASPFSRRLLRSPRRDSISWERESEGDREWTSGMSKGEARKELFPRQLRKSARKVRSTLVDRRAPHVHVPVPCNNTVPRGASPLHVVLHHQPCGCG